MNALIEIAGLSKTCTRGKQKLEVLHHVNLETAEHVTHTLRLDKGTLVEQVAA